MFFDTLGMVWQYEPEGFVLSDGTHYLPDFFVAMAERPGDGYWAETKGAQPTDAESRKVAALALGTGHHGYLLHGAPGDNAPIRWSVRSGYVSIKDGGCALEDPIHELGSSALVLCCATDLVSYARVRSAVAAARGARFEHGETPI